MLTRLITRLEGALFAHRGLTLAAMVLLTVVMGAFAGWYFLGEQMGKIRILGAVVIFAGIILIAVFG